MIPLLGQSRQETERGGERERDTVSLWGRTVRERKRETERERKKEREREV